MPQPGWYRDPVDEFELRWWSGREWTDDVRTGRFVGSSPPEPTPIPQTESMVWCYGRYALTTHSAHVSEDGQPVVVPWWAVAGVTSTSSAVGGTGTVVLHIAYPGYTDRSQWRMHAIPEHDHVHALAYSWMRRHRRAAGYG